MLNVMLINVHNIHPVCINILQNKECRRFTIYPPAKFYPAYKWEDNTGKSKAKKMMQIMRNATTIHLRDTHDQDTKRDMAIYRMAAKKHCPKIYKFAAENF